MYCGRTLRGQHEMCAPTGIIRAILPQQYLPRVSRADFKTIILMAALGGITGLGTFIVWLMSSARSSQSQDDMVEDSDQ